MHKILIACSLAAVALAAPEADADALYGHFGYGYTYPTLYNSYPNWPGVSAPGYSSTVFGLRGKRSAEAEPEADADASYAVAAYPYAYTPALYNSYPNWPGVSAPGFSSTVFGLRGKRSADADAHYGAYGYGLRAYSPYYYGYGLTGVAGHPTGSSYVARSVQGLSLRGKRSADAEPEADAYYGGYGYGGYGGYGYSGHGYSGYYGRGYGSLGYRGYGYNGLNGYGRGYYHG